MTDYYKYQMHAHTYPASDCGGMLPHELVDELYIGKYSGCVLTNHFMNGNTGIDRDLHWDVFVEKFASDYCLAKQRADKYGIDILFGLEEHIGEGREILCYGVTPEILKSHPELRTGDVKVWHRVMSENGCLCIQAHPYRCRSYIASPEPLPLDLIDGIEVYNAANNEEENFAADKFAAKHSEIIKLSGADTHTVSTACVAGIMTKHRITDEQKLVEVLRSGEYKLIK